MARLATQIKTLHGFTLKELIDFLKNTDSKYTRLALIAATMRYYGYSNEEIINATNLSNISIFKHIKTWNTKDIKSVEDHRDGNR